VLNKNFNFEKMKVTFDKLIETNQESEEKRKGKFDIFLFDSYFCRLTKIK
jgi:hypothetical protein